MQEDGCDMGAHQSYLGTEKKSPVILNCCNLVNAATLSMSPVYQVWLKPSCRYSERGKKTRQTEEEFGRQHQGMDRSGVRQVPEGSREQRKMEETGCKIICGAPSRLRDR